MTSSRRGGGSPPGLRLRAYAKINLDLRVAVRRADGMHDLTTVLQSIALHDTVVLRQVDGPWRLRCDLAGVPVGRENLVWAAGRGLWRRLGRRGDPHGVSVSITKRIPMAAGLGGGTADAVAALNGLCRLWEVPPDPALLHDVAAEVGADGPFFLVGGTALGVGRGDHVYPLAELPGRWVVLVVPPRGVSTAAAYGWLDRDRRSRRRPRALAPPPVSGGGLDLTAVVNDLQAPVARRRPEIRQVVRSLATQGAELAAMTGSGSTVFGLYRRRAVALAAAEAARRDGWRVLTTRTLDRTRLL